MKKDTLPGFLNLIPIAIILWAGLSLCAAVQAAQGPEGEKVVTKVIDGDTVVVEGGDTVRLLGIDADERNYPCYEPAKRRLEQLILNKKVLLEADKQDRDQYQRYLRYIFLDDENICTRMVREGLAVARFFPENVKYRDEIVAAEQEAMQNKVGCKWAERPNPLQKERGSVSGPGVSSGEVITPDEAATYAGSVKTIEGDIVDTYQSDKNNIFLRFDRPHPDQSFTVVIFSDSLWAFPPEPARYYLNKTVRVTGRIKMYEGKPEVVLQDPSRIEIVK